MMMTHAVCSGLLMFVCIKISFFRIKNQNENSSETIVYKEETKDQESIQSSTTPDPGHRIRK